MKTRFDIDSRKSQVILDGLTFAISLFAAYLIRFESWPSGSDLWQFLVWLPILVSARILVHSVRGIYRMVWRFVSLPDCVQVAKSLLIVTVMLVTFRLLVHLIDPRQVLLQLPLSIITLEGLLSLTGSLTLRALRRFQHQHQRLSAAVASQPPRRVLLYGAGRAGQLLHRELEMNCDVDVIGFVDDDPYKIGTTIVDKPVLGNGDDLPRLVQHFQIDQIIISMATAGKQTLAGVVAKCNKAKVPTKIIPSVLEILSGGVPITQLREPQIEDVLGRSSVEVHDFENLAGQCYRGKRVLVTGAGGSIGSELIRQLLRLNPVKIAIVDKDENSIYELEQELARRGKASLTEAVIADCRDRGRLDAVFSHFRPSIVFHAAAHKHVPLMERHPCEAVLNNVLGTRNALEAAMKFSVERFVFVSTDKAVNPVNVMGATKRVGELLIQGAAGQGGTRVACVRFGNVLGSRGSVIPLFQKQIAEGGPVTITHPEVMRYFMTIQEAVQLILCAGSMAERGEIFVLEMGTPRNILQLAHEMISLSGLEPEKDIRTIITGLRPGEKLNEELFGPEEKPSGTLFDKLYVVYPEACDRGYLGNELARLVASAQSNDSPQVREILKQISTGSLRQRPKERAATAHA